MSEILWAFRCRGAGCPFKNGVPCEDDYCGVQADDIKMPTSISAHEGNLRELPCVVTGRTGALSLHHCRGASMSLTAFGSPGSGQKQNPGLQVRLSMEYHVGNQGIDARIGSSAQAWERNNGTQVELLNSTCRQLRYSVWMLSMRWATPLVRRRVELFCDQQPSLFRRP